MPKPPYLSSSLNIILGYPVCLGLIDFLFLLSFMSASHHFKILVYICTDHVCELSIQLDFIFMHILLFLMSFAFCRPLDALPLLKWIMLSSFHNCVVWVISFYEFVSDTQTIRTWEGSLPTGPTIDIKEAFRLREYIIIIRVIVSVSASPAHTFPFLPGFAKTWNWLIFCGVFMLCGTISIVAPSQTLLKRTKYF